MSWFDDQIKERIIQDNELFEETFVNIASAVVGRRVTAALKDRSRVSKDAIDAILKYYHIKSQDVPSDMKDVNEQLEYLMRPHGIMRRSVTLEKGWYNDAFGAMLGVKKSDGSVVAFIPGKLKGYTYFDVESGNNIRIDSKNEDMFEPEAIAFYIPFPLQKIRVRNLLLFSFSQLSAADYLLFIAATFVATLLGLFTPIVYNRLLSEDVLAGNYKVLVASAIFLISLTISTMIIGSIKSLLRARIDTKLGVSVEAATMMRVLSLPAEFFKQYSAGELASRVNNMNSLCSMLVDMVLQSGLTSVFSLVYIAQIFAFSKALVVPSLIIILVTVTFSIVSTLMQMKISKRIMEISSKENGMSYSIISGVQKIKLSGSEKRVFSRWGNLYAKKAELIYNPPTFIKINTVISTAIGLVGTIVMYYVALASKISVADYYSFNMAYGMVSGAFTSLAGVALNVANIRPILDMVKPILDAEPEVSEGKQVLNRISGGIEMSHVSFRYSENMPLILDDLSLKITPGQYVAIVGKTGCGKSTLLRLLLGFEHPQRGAVYYDGKDIKNVDLKSLRKKIGVVMQNAKLFQGDIFSNIAISAPFLTMDEAWEAAELSGMADDIRSMPMGMFTMISEGSGGISGGQRQRMMIARAIAPKPKILMFDEATSALDNLTQKKVSESLDNLKCTRIVIAHRLSTIKQCDRIIVLDKGKIIEDGTYEELINNNGFFAELVSRQQVGQG